jgi:DNA-binding CsgD family transcriptional regulator
LNDDPSNGTASGTALSAAALSDDTTSAAIVVALAVEDLSLNDRLAALLADVPGLRLARDDEHADVMVVSAAKPNERADGHQSLTGRELEVLTLLAEGASNKAIARRLGISVHTAKFHVGQLLDKLDATGRTDAVAHAARLGVLHL